MADCETWRIVVGISSIIPLVVAILLALIFLIIVIHNRTCRTVPLMLTCNSCIATIIFGSNMLAIAVFALHNDIKRRAFQDIFCTFRDYLGFLGTALLLYSFALQALYRYIIVVYPARVSWHSVRVQGTLACLCWFFCIVSLLPWLLLGISTYDVDNQACILPFGFSVPIIYNVILVYFIPVTIIILIYFKLVRYVHQLNTHSALSLKAVQICRRECVMVRRIIIIISILLILGIPYTTFLFISFVTKPPKYYYRIALFFSDLSQALVMIILFKFSKPVMDVVRKFKRKSSDDTQSSAI